MNRTDRIFITSIVLMIVIPLSLIGTAYVYTISQKIHYTGYVTAVWRHANGEIYAATATHNLLTSLGGETIEQDLGVAAGNTWLVIQITNATFTPATGSTYCCGGSDITFVSNNDLKPAAGVYASTGNGAWTVTHTFTLTVAVTVTIYGAALTTTTAHGSGAANNMAEALLPSTAPLSQVGDNVMIQWALSAA